MKTIAEIRHENFELIQQSFPTSNAFALRLGIAQSYLSQLNTRGSDGNYRKNLGDKTARKVEFALELPTGWLDTPQSSFPAARAAGANSPLNTERARSSLPRASGIQNALIETAQRLVAAGLLSDLDCLALLQGWQPLIAKLNENPVSP